MTMNKAIASFAVLAVLGAATAAGLLIYAGLNYRAQEDQGMQPGYSPDWVVLGTMIGIWTAGAAVVLFIILLVARTVLRSKQNAAKGVSA